MPYAKKLRTFALVAAALLLLGTASASGAGKIGGNQIKKNAIASKHIKKNAVQSSDIKQGAVQSSEIKNNTVQSGDITDGTITSGDIKNGTVGPGDLANGSVTADKIAPGAVSFQSGLWSTVLRNQTGAAVSGVQAGPVGQPEGDGSLRLATSGPTDLAAFGNSLEFLGIRLDQITQVSYSTYNDDDPPLVRPSLRIEINPHLVDDATLGGGYEFTTLVHEPVPGDDGVGDPCGRPRRQHVAPHRRRGYRDWLHPGHPMHLRRDRRGAGDPRR